MWIAFAVLLAAGFLFDAPPARLKVTRTEDGHQPQIAAREVRIAAIEAHTARLKAENEELRVEIRRLEAMAHEEERVRAWYAAQNACSSPASGRPDAIPVAVLDAAAALHVSEVALRAAFRAAQDPSDRNLARLREAGTDGFRGIAALLRERGEIRDLGAVVAASWSPEMAGEERALIDAAEWDSDAAIAALGYCDTPRARDYLIARLRRRDAVAWCAEALGRLREPLAVPLLADAIAGADTQAQAAAITALGDIGGDGAREALRGFLRDPGPDLVAEAACALRRVDPALARREAAALLAGPRAAQLTERQLHALRECAK
jgi:hypothetical protein